MHATLSRLIQLSESRPGTVRLLSGIHVTLEQGRTTSWVTVTRTGTFSDPRYGEFEISKGLLEQIIDNFNRRVYGQDIFYDVSHHPENGSAGKVLQLKLEGDRLRAQVEWTPYGIEAIKTRGYTYSSIEYHENFRDNETGEIHGPVMFGAALVTRPCIKRLDPIQLSEPDGSECGALTAIHPELKTTLLQEIYDMWKELIRQLTEKLNGLKLAEPVITKLVAAFEHSAATVTDEPAAKALMESFAGAGKQIADTSAGNKEIRLSIDVPETKPGLTADDVRQLMQEEDEKRLAEVKKLSDRRDSNLKLLGDTIGADKGLSDEVRQELTEAVSDLITADMSDDQIRKLAAVQIASGNKLAVAQKLSGMGFSFPAGRITVDESSNVKALQEAIDARMGISSRADAVRYSNTGGKLQKLNQDFAAKVLAEFDSRRGADLHAEHKMLSGGDSRVSDVAVPAIFERTVIREALYNMIGLQFVDVGTLPFSGTAMIPYSYRDTTGAGINSTRVYEGVGIPRAALKQVAETAYVLPQKIAFEVTDELRYLTANGQLDWDAVAENARNASRIIGEDSERLIFNEILDASDQYSTTAVVSESVGTGNGTKTIFPVAQFPVVRPKKIFDLQGAQVGSTLYPITVTTNAVARPEYDGSNTQAAGLYWVMDYNVGELRFVTELGAPSAVTSTHAIVASYTYTTNIYKFDTDQGAAKTDEFWDSFLYRYGLRKNIIESDRLHTPNFGLMSGTLRTQIEQARSFIESGARNGTGLDEVGNLGTVKGVPNFRTTAPGLVMGDQRVIIGERGVTRYRMMKPWAMGQLENQRNAQGRFTGQKEAYGDQFVVIHTPTMLKSSYTSMALFSTAGRVSR